MTQFLLVGSRNRPGVGAELALSVVARQVAATIAWHGWLRRWGLLQAIGLPRDAVSEPRACLVVLATDDQAAERLAAGWGRVTGYQVAVLQLTAETGLGVGS